MRNNVFTADLDSFIDRMAALSFYQFFIDSQLKRAKNSIEKDLAYFREKNWPIGNYFFGSGVSIADIFVKGEWVTRAPAKSHSTSGEDVLRMNDETQRYFNGFVVVQQFEAIELFLKRVYAKFLCDRKCAVVLRREAEFRKAHQGWEEIAGTNEYYEKYAKWATKRNSNDAMDDFDLHIDWNKATITGWYDMSFHDFIKVLGQMRHCLVHEHGKVTEERLSKLTDEQRAYVDPWILETLNTKERLILPEREPVEKCFEVLISYARGLYVFLSELCGMRDETMYFNTKSHEGS